ncbi:molybdopterin-synthase adenylyltransferase MoeB [soil metagenome]
MLIPTERLEAAELLSPLERERYARHLILPEVGADGQRRLKAARVLCIGAGGLGSPVALYLAAAGVGTLGLVEFDTVERSNLQRQILFGEGDLGLPKLAAAAARLRDLNPGIAIVKHPHAFTAESAMEVAAPYDLIVDGTDNFATRYLSNDVAVFQKKPNVYGSIFRFEGQCAVFHPAAGGPCYRCLFPVPPEPGLVPSCAEGGVLGVLPGLVGVLQATEALKLVLGIGQPLTGRLVHVDALSMKFREFRLKRDPQCPVCGDHPTITAPIDYEAFCGGPATSHHDIPSISIHHLQRELGKAAVIDVREPGEWEIAHLPGATLIPLAQLHDRLRDLDPTARTLVHCKSGTRSAKAVRLLRQAGFTSVFNVEGGIDAWAAEIDPDMPTY